MGGGSFCINIREFPNNYAKHARFHSKKHENCSEKGNFWSPKGQLSAAKSSTFGRWKFNFRNATPHIFRINPRFSLSNSLIFRKLFAGAHKTPPPFWQSTDRNIQPCSALIFVKKPKTALEKCQEKVKTGAIKTCRAALKGFRELRGFKVLRVLKVLKDLRDLKLLRA